LNGSVLAFTVRIKAFNQRNIRSGEKDIMTLFSNKQRLGTVLMAVGVLLVLSAGIGFARERIQAGLVQLRLQNLPPERPGAVALALASQQPGSALQSETPTALPAWPALAQGTALTGPTGGPGAVPEAPATETGSPAATPSPASTAIPSPTAVQSPTATLSPTNTAAPTPLPSSAPVHIVIPDLGINVPVQEMTWHEVKTANGIDSEWQIPEYAGGHAVNSAALGEPGNVVISGHNNIYGRVFIAISQAWGGKTEVVDKATERSHLLDGRLIELDGADGRRFDYVITDFLRVHDSGVPLSQRLANAKYIQPTGDTRLTITTCWPPWSNTYRLVVIAKPSS
jgi:sortase (surface protein transpeptidase)